MLAFSEPLVKGGLSADPLSSEHDWATARFVALEGWVVLKGHDTHTVLRESEESWTSPLYTWEICTLNHWVAGVVESVEMDLRVGRPRNSVAEVMPLLVPGEPSVIGTVEYGDGSDRSAVVLVNSESFDFDLPRRLTKASLAAERIFLRLHRDGAEN